MASRSARSTELLMSRKWNQRETSPERNKVWTETPNRKLKSEQRKVPVVYYLTRNGKLEHPHFMEVPLLYSPEGLYLKDVINRLNFLRGKGMASLYSWSAKRSYRNGFVWHDLSEHDFIYPAHGQEYVLKGSELLESQSDELAISNSTEEDVQQDVPKLRQDHEFPVVSRRRNQSWCSADFHEYRVYKAETSNESSAAADASTQTDDRRRRRRAIRAVEEEIEEEEEEDGDYQYGKENNGVEHGENQSTELSRGEISPPPSDSSPETLETLMKADKVIVRPETGDEDQTANIQSSTKGRASSVLMQLLSCGSMSFKDCGSGYGKDQGLSLISHYKTRLPRGTGSGSASGSGSSSSSNQVEKYAGDGTVEYNEITERVKLEDKEYFSGSLIETKKDVFAALKRSSSFNADRSTKLELREREIEGVRAKCIPRRAKNQSTKKEGNSDMSCSSGSNASIVSTSSSQHGSKRIVVQPQV